MGLIRQHRTLVSVLVLAFSLTSLGVLPTALCCQAMAAEAPPDGDVCPHQQAHGEACPMHRPPPVNDSGCRSFEPCQSGDALLAGMLILTGAMPETAQVADAEMVVQALGIESATFVAPFEAPPHAPPPRV